MDEPLSNLDAKLRVIWPGVLRQKFDCLVLPVYGLACPDLCEVADAGRPIRWNSRAVLTGSPPPTLTTGPKARALADTLVAAWARLADDAERVRGDRDREPQRR